MPDKLFFLLLASASSLLSSEWVPQHIVAIAEYPLIARAARLQGDVIVECTLDAEGTVIGARVISGQHLLAKPALQNVKLWKFRKTDEKTLTKSNNSKIPYHFSLLEKKTRNQPAVSFTFDYPNQAQIISESACSDHLSC